MLKFGFNISVQTLESFPKTLLTLLILLFAFTSADDYSPEPESNMLIGH